jgi:hypothetical protein
MPGPTLVAPWPGQHVAALRPRTPERAPRPFADATTTSPARTQDLAADPRTHHSERREATPASSAQHASASKGTATNGQQPGRTPS